jgi:hypothetical protein
VIHFGVAGLVLRDSVLGVRLSFKPCWYRSHLLGVARNAHVLSSYLERVTGRQLRIRKNRRRLLGEDDRARNSKKAKARRMYIGESSRAGCRGPASNNSNGFVSSTINTKVVL